MSSITDFMARGKPVESTALAHKPVKPEGEEIINMTIRLPRSKWKRVADMSTDNRESIQKITMDAYKEYFEKRGLPF